MSSCDDEVDWELKLDVEETSELAEEEEEALLLSLDASIVVAVDGD